MNAIAAAAPALAMVAVFALLWGGVVQIRRDRRKGVLMIVLAAVILGNVLIATV
ncbi:hypothetical protein [Sphingomonas aracearum]|uniref:hypothetical protein n=1 Tax=Sphingomonas aracearum TaxID=2283317 RepID=UPI0015F08F34|nr:hypothetical protein [Sphingomonas aracearum]